MNKGRRQDHLLFCL